MSAKTRKSSTRCSSSENLSPPRKIRNIDSSPYTPKHPIGKSRSRVKKDTKKECLFSNPALTAVLDCEKISSRRATRVVAVTACALGMINSQSIFIFI